MRQWVEWQVIVEWKTGNRDESGWFTNYDRAYGRFKKALENPAVAHVEMLEKTCSVSMKVKEWPERTLKRV